MKARSRWETILASYSDEKRRWDRTYPSIAYIYRPASLFVCWLLPARVTANELTLLSYLVSLASLLLLVHGSFAGLLTGSILLVLFSLLDCVDGALARLRGTSNALGRFLDGLAAPAFVLPYFALGIGLARAAGSGQGEFILAVGAATTILKLLVPQIRQSFHLCFGEVWEEDKRARHATGHAGRWYYRLYYNLTDLQGHDVVLLLAVLAGQAEAFLLVSFAVSALDLGAVLALYLRRAWRLGARSGKASGHWHGAD
ncbi:MAG: CDP-alcohol phosphatidyltransferase family protein [Candidatus Rokubacteria bacterium]|nr:CDP-alcohol phosphatidyltransferase family protein [Candidatus Rokubacteria bacterium]